MDGQTQAIRTPTDILNVYVFEQDVPEVVAFIRLKYPAPGIWIIPHHKNSIRDCIYVREIPLKVSRVSLTSPKLKPYSGVRSVQGDSVHGVRAVKIRFSSKSAWFSIVRDSTRRK